MLGRYTVRSGFSPCDLRLKPLYFSKARYHCCLSLYYDKNVTNLEGNGNSRSNSTIIRL